MRKFAVLLLCPLVWNAFAPPAASAEESFAEDRRGMVSVIQAIAKAAGPVAGKSAIDPRVLKVMGRIPRHRFVAEWLRDDAYGNRPLPIGFGQTISQPYIVALMTDLLGLESHHKVLELGTGSGYQAAVAARLVRRVYTIEIVPQLAKSAKNRLARLGVANVSVRQGDGYYGWPEQGPFDAIIVTAAANHIPPALVRQLKPGGRMVVPVGNPFFTQQLMLVTKAADGKISTRHLLPVRFVPLTGEH